MSVMGNLSLMVNFLRAWKSSHFCQLPSFFKTKTTKDEYGIVMGFMTPASSSSWIVFSISLFCANGFLYGHTYGCWLPRFKVIPRSCSPVNGGKPFGVSKTCWCLYKTLYKLAWISSAMLSRAWMAWNWEITPKWPFFNKFSILWELMISGNLT